VDHRARNSIGRVLEGKSSLTVLNRLP